MHFWPVEAAPHAACMSLHRCKGRGDGGARRRMCQLMPNARPRWLADESFAPAAVARPIAPPRRQMARRGLPRCNVTHRPGTTRNQHARSPSIIPKVITVAIAMWGYPLEYCSNRNHQRHPTGSNNTQLQATSNPRRKRELRVAWSEHTLPSSANKHGPCCRQDPNKNH